MTIPTAQDAPKNGDHQQSVGEESSESSTPKITEHKKNGLGQLAATAICGNDIASSCLYVSALAIIYSGKWAPLVLLLVSGVLFLYRAIYAEVVGALPLNGGAYNALLNTTSKFRASIAACLTILSYMATAVISASEACHYAHTIFPYLPIESATIGLLGIFMVLSIIGITESSVVAVIIFIFHLTSLMLLLGVGIFFISQHGLSTLHLNLATPTQGGLGLALLLGFSASLLGISGFESSANFVEEQAEGVFPLTLRNMWIAVSFFNPAMALLALALIPIPQVAAHQDALLTHLGIISGGGWLGLLVSFDGALVLSGAVLTSFVGVNGLVHRMTLDRCLPQFFLKKCRRGTTHRIIIAFFLLCVSVLFITEGELQALAGVYTISFLSVMALFALGNLYLKTKRAQLPRPTSAPLINVLLGISAVVIGLVGNVIIDFHYLLMFMDYFIPALILISIMLGRVTILNAFLFLARSILMFLIRGMTIISQGVRNRIQKINSQQVVFFTRGDNISNLNKAMLYVRQNEHTNKIKVVTVVPQVKDISPNLAKDLKILNEIYPEIEIEFVPLTGSFGPDLIQQLSEQWHIPPNLMFIGSPGDHLIYGLADLGGVRLII